MNVEKAPIDHVGRPLRRASATVKSVQDGENGLEATLALETGSYWVKPGTRMIMEFYEVDHAVTIEETAPQDGSPVQAG